MPYLLALAAILFAAAPLLTPGFGGFDPDLFPVPQVDPPAVPAGYAFGIWGLIYAWLVVATTFQALRRREAPDWAAMRPPLLVSLGIGVAWLSVALISPVWATILIWAMWLGAVLALRHSPARDGWAGHAPVGLYAGWLTAASCVSLALLAAGYGWMSQFTAAVLALLLALGLSIGVMRLRPDAPFYPAGVIWALIAVVVGNLSGGPAAVVALAGGGAVALAALMMRNLATRPPLR